MGILNYFLENVPDSAASTEGIGSWLLLFMGSDSSGCEHDVAQE